MIRQLRKSIQGPAGKVLIVLFCIPFALFGAEALLSVTQPDSSIGTVNGEPLSRYEYSSIMGRMAEQAGGTGRDEELDQMIRESALQNLIRQELLYQFGQSAGLEIPESIVDGFVRSAPDFQQNGRYSQALFAGVARDLGLTQDQLMESFRRNLLVYRMFGALNSSSQAIDADQLAALWGQERDLSYLSLSLEDFIPKTLADEDLQAYYDENEPVFTTRPEVDISLVELSSSELDKRADMRVGDEQVREAYEAYAEQAATQAERRAAHIMLQWEQDDQSAKDAALQKARQIHDALEAGADFAEQARQHSEDFSAEQGGDLGFSQGDVFPEEFEQVLGTLEVGQYSEPVVIDQAVHIIRLVQAEDAVIEDFAEKSEELRQQLHSQAREELEQELTERLGELAYSIPTVEELAEEMALEVQQEDGVFMGRPDGGLAALPEVQQAAFAQDLIEQGFISEPMRTPDGGLVVLQVREHRPARQQSFEEAREEVRRQLEQELASHELEKKAQGLEAALEAGEKLEQAAVTAGIEASVKTLQGMNRNSPLLDRVVLEDVFGIPVEAIDQWRRVSTEKAEVWVQFLGARIPEESIVSGLQASFFKQQIAAMQSALENVALLDHLEQQADIRLKTPDELAAEVTQ